MSGKKFFCLLGILLPALLFSSTAFGWAGTTHSLLCKRNFDLPVVSQFLGGVDQSAIENYILEPSEESHNVQWTSMTQRKYIDTATACSNGFNWNSLDETTRLQYLMHHAGDVSVPAHHPPAVYEYNSQWAEGLCEVAAAGGYLTVGELPDVANTTSYTHSRNGHSYNFTGTIDQVVDTFEDACRDNAAWYKSTINWLFGHSWHWPSDIASANWNGLKIDLMLQRAVFVDYFLAKQDVVTVWETYPISYVGSNITLSQQGAYDPDCVSWNSNGTYSQISGIHSQGIQYCLWDVNGDVASGGDWDYGAYSTDLTLPVSTLLAMGVPTNEWSLYYTAVVDNENKVGYAADYMWIYGSAPEPASLSLLAIGGLALLRRKK